MLILEAGRRIRLWRYMASNEMKGHVGFVGKFTTGITQSDC
jgi:hypothetical protein